jgi:hypothetical protein
VAEPLSVGAVVVVVVDGSATANASCAVDIGTMSASAAPAQTFFHRSRRSARDVGGTPERAARADERVKREPKVPAMVPCPALSHPVPSCHLGTLYEWAGLTTGSLRAFGDRTHARRSLPPTPAEGNSRD